MTRTYMTLEEAEAKEQAQKLGQIDPASLQGKPIPVRRWLVPDVIPRDAVTILSGDGGVGKSLLAMQLMTAGATAGLPGGGNWLGLEVPKFTSLGFFCEDDAPELHRRQADLNRHFGCDFQDLQGMVWWPRVGRDNVLMRFNRDASAPPRFLRPWAQLVATVRARPTDLIVIDTAADVFGGNENFRGDVRNFLNYLRRLARIHDGAVLLMAHPSLAGQQNGSGLSGSTAWNATARARLLFTRLRNQDDEEDDARLLKGVKSNYSKTGGKIKLRYDSGAFVRDDPGTGMVAAIEQKNLMQRFVEFVAQMQARDHYISPNYSGAYAPTVMCAMHPNEKLSKRALGRAMFQALKEGLLKVEDEKSHGRVRKRLVAAAPAAAAQPPS